MRKTTLRMLSLLTAFVMTFTSVDMAVFAEEVSAGDVVITEETSEAVSFSDEETEAVAEEAVTTAEDTTEETATEEAISETVEETTTEELALDAEGDPVKKDDFISLIQDHYYKNDNGNYDISMWFVFPDEKVRYETIVTIKVDDESVNSQISYVQMPWCEDIFINVKIRDFVASVAEHKVEVFFYDTVNEINFYIEDSLNLIDESYAVNSVEFVDYSSLVSDKRTDVDVTYSYPGKTNKKYGSKSVTIVPHGGEESEGITLNATNYKEMYVNNTSKRFNKGYVYELELNGEKYSFDDDFLNPYIDGTMIGATITVPYSSLEAGIYDAILENTSGEKFRLDNFVEIIKDKTVITFFRSANSGRYSCDSTGDYIALVVYGNNIADDMIPVFYMDEARKDVAAVYDTTDENCAVSPDLGDGRIYKVKKKGIKDAKGGLIYLSYGDDSRITYRGTYNNIYDGDTVVGLKGRYDVSNITHVLFNSGAGKILRIYVAQSALSENPVGDLITVSYEEGKWVSGKYNRTTYNYTGNIAKDANGEFYVEVPASETVFTKMAADTWGAYGTVTYGDVDDEGNLLGWQDSFSLLAKNTVTTIANIAVANGTWVLRTPDMSVLKSGNAGEKLTNDEIIKASQYPYMTLEVTANGETKISQVVFKSLLTDTIVLNNEGNETSATVAKGDVLELAEPEVPAQFAEDAEWKNNHSFEGWYLATDVKHTNRLEKVTATGGKTVEVVAYWKAKIYKIQITTGASEGRYGEEFTYSNIKTFELSYDGTIEITEETVGISGGDRSEYYFGKNAELCKKGTFTYQDCLDYAYKIDEAKGIIYLTNISIAKEYLVLYHTNGVKIEGLTAIPFKTDLSEPIVLTDLSKAPYLREDFLGWYTDPSLDEKYKITEVEKYHVGNVDVYAKWAQKEVTVKFDTNLDSYEGLTTTSAPISDMTKDIGEIFRLPASSYKVTAEDGSKWKFAGWSFEKTGYVTADTICAYPNEIIAIPEDAEYIKDGVVTLYALYSKGIEISYILNGGELPADAKTSFEIGSKAYTLPTPTRAGCDFLGWYGNDQFGVFNKDAAKKITTVSDKASGIVVIEARWKERTYKLSLVPNGGKGKTVNLNVPLTEHVDLTKYTDYTKTGYDFAGFTLDGENVINSFSPELLEDVKNSKNGTKFTLKAKWTPTKYTITYDTKGGDSLESKEYEISTADTELDIPTREGYTFAGWFTDENYKKISGSFKNEKAMLKKGTVGDITLHAKWTRPYTLVLHVDDKTERFEGFNYGIAKAIPTPKTKVEGKSVAGWSIINAGAKKYAPTEKICMDDSIDAANELHLWALMKNSKYTIVYNNQTGTDYWSNPTYETKTQSVNTGKVIALTKNSFKKAGYAFVGWSRIANAAEPEYANGEKVDLSLLADGDNNVKLYAVWRNAFKITFDENAEDAVAGRTSYTYTYGREVKDKVFATISVPTRPNYTFAGWYTEPECKKAFKKISATQQGNINLYAKWVPATYTVTYDCNTPANTKITGNMKAQKFTYYKSTALKKNTYKATGYEFLGWSTDPDSVDATYANGEKVTDLGVDVTLYAVWKPITYTITYKYSITGYNFDNANTNPLSYTVNTEIKLEDCGVPGYSFCGWYSDKAFKKQVKNISAGSTGNITLYAKLEKMK